VPAADVEDDDEEEEEDEDDAGLREFELLLCELPLELDAELELVSITTARVNVLSATLAAVEIFPRAAGSSVTVLLGNAALALAVTCCPAPMAIRVPPPWVSCAAVGASSTLPCRTVTFAACGG
jgi:hypothetical protein